MGWRNLFVKLNVKNKNKKKSFSINRLEEFIEHHNNWYNYFEADDIKRIEESDEIPGEELVCMKIIIRNRKNGKKEYWAHFGNLGGSGWTIGWAKKYFDNITIHDSYSFKYYGKEWVKWETMTFDEFKKNILI